MKLKNPFSDETRELYFWNYACWSCGKNNNLELDHIQGRESNSPLNAYLNCRACHSAKNTKDNGKRLQKALEFLALSNYQFTEKDVAFYEKYKDKYEFN